MQPESAPSEWSKLERIRYLLDMRSYIFDPTATSPLGVRSGKCTCGLGLPACDSRCGSGLMPMMSTHHSVVELERVLQLLFHACPGDYRHLAAFRWGSEYRTVTELLRRRRPNGKHEIVPTRVRAKIMPRWIRMERVRSAEAFLELKFRGDVDIPRELWDALNTPAVAA